MLYRQYLILLMLSAFVQVAIVSVTNYKIDPANIYHEIDGYKPGEDSAKQYVTQLIKTKNGLLLPNNSWNERDIKSLLAKSDMVADCAVIGSSHAMQISSINKNASLTHLCPSIMNLGVPGGTLEDYLALSYILLHKPDKPKTIVFGVDPWALDFYRDSRWVRYKESYYLMRALLDSGDSMYEDGSWSKIAVNLINPYYFFRSLRSFGLGGPTIEEVLEINEEVGVKYPALLPDGSLVYSKDEIAKRDYKYIQVGGSPYKIRNPQFTEAAVRVLSDLVGFLQNAGINVVLVLTPYHHNVWADRESSTTKALVAVESRVIRLGNELGIRVLGSYNPYTIGCSKEEFFDFMHAKRSCLSKIAD